MSKMKADTWKTILQIVISVLDGNRHFIGRYKLYGIGLIIRS